MRRHFVIIAILALAAVVRLVLIDQSFWLDEAAQALESARPLSQQLQIAQDFQPPLFHVALHFWMQLGTSESWLRMISVVAGLVAIYATYLIGTKLFRDLPKNHGKKIGLLAALFLSLSQLHVYYSQELRPYSLAAMWATLSWLVLFHFAENKKPRVLVLYVLCTIGGLYSMYLYPFLLIAQIVFIVWHERKLLRNYLIAIGLSVVGFLPWLPSFLEQLRVGTTLQTSLPGWAQVVSIPQLKSLPLIFLKFVGGQLPVGINLSSVIIFLIPTALVIWLFATLRSNKVMQKIKPIIIWLILPVVLAWLVSFIVPVLSFKRVLFCLPALYLLIATSIVRLSNTKTRVLVTCVFLVCEAVGLGLYWSTPQLQRESWRETHQEIYAKFSAENTLVIFGFDAPFAPWRWYDRGESIKLATLTFPSIPVQDLQLSHQMQEVLNFKTVFVFDYLLDLTDPSRKIDAWLLSHGYKETATIDTKNMGFVRQYDKQSFFSMR